MVSNKYLYKYECLSDCWKFHAKLFSFKLEGTLYSCFHCKQQTFWTTTNESQMHQNILVIPDINTDCKQLFRDIWMVSQKTYKVAHSFLSTGYISLVARYKASFETRFNCICPEAWQCSPDLMMWSFWCILDALKNIIISLQQENFIWLL